TSRRARRDRPGGRRGQRTVGQGGAGETLSPVDRNVDPRQRRTHPDTEIETPCHRRSVPLGHRSALPELTDRPLRTPLEPATLDILRRTGTASVRPYGTGAVTSDRFRRMVRQTTECPRRAHHFRLTHGR